MKQVGGVWLPDHETHLVEWMTKKNQVVDGKLTYQLDKQNAAYSFCKQFRHAIDIGAHCGLWSMIMATKFKELWAFEPVAEHRECFKANIPGDYVEETTNSWLRMDDGCKVFLAGGALGEKFGRVSMETAPSSSGDTRVIDGGTVPLWPLDEFCAGSEEVDFIKLDCEGYELFALRGGENLIKRCMPVICVEQKPGRGQRFGLPERGAVEYLQSLGYKLAKEMSGDFIMVPA